MRPALRHYYHFIPSRFPAEKFDEIATQMKGHYGRFDAEVKGVVASLFGRNQSPRAQRFSHLRVAAFESYDAHDAYQKAPLHDDVTGYLLGLTEEMVAGDIEGPTYLGPPANYYSVTLLLPKAAAADPTLWDNIGEVVAAARREARDVAFLEAGANLSPYAKGWTHLLAAAFASQTGCAEFEASPQHAALVKLLEPHFELHVAAIGR